MSLLILNIRKLVTLPPVAGPGGPNGRSFRDMSGLLFSPICQLGGGPVCVFVGKLASHVLMIGVHK